MPRNLAKKIEQNQYFHTHISAYSNAAKKYMRTDYKQVQKLLQGLELTATCQSFKLRYPLLTLLKAVAKKLLLNGYECLVFGYLLSQSTWQISDPIIDHNRLKITDLVFINDPTDYNQVKRIQLFLILTCYNTKDFLLSDMKIYKKEILRICPSFFNIYKQWLRYKPQAYETIDLRKLNAFFATISKPPPVNDYNHLIDQILFISPCYTVPSKQQQSEAPQLIRTATEALEMQDLHQILIKNSVSITTFEENKYDVNIFNWEDNLSYL